MPRSGSTRRSRPKPRATPKRGRPIEPRVASRGVRAAEGPRRTCVGCRASRPSAQLVRLTRRASATLVADGPSDGRGAWICRDSANECVDSALRRRAFERAWRVTVDPDEHDEIRRAVARVTTSVADGATDHTTDAPGVTVGTTTGKG